MDYRIATPADAPTLAGLNQALIRDEQHRNEMNLDQLIERMTNWLDCEYQAVLFESNQTTVGYTLFRREPEFVYIRQFFVSVEHRRKGVGRNAILWLWQNTRRDAPRLRIDVLVGNVAGREFWHSVGFHDYCLTMEAVPFDRTETLQKA